MTHSLVLRLLGDEVSVNRKRVKVSFHHAENMANELLVCLIIGNDPAL